ncbi:MAG: LD-carboxypeptidase [Candidatus Melainabacteria bacterium]|nr:LD-carboxypeptidase [Candidatus Melainabacteria bacterium]
MTTICKPIKPKALRPGDTVGIVAPSTPPFEPSALEFACQWLGKLGLKYKIGKHVFDSWGDLAGVDEARLADLHEMWADPEISAIIPVRGGNGSVRLLPKLDFKLISTNPKILVGYSDITGLLIPIQQATGLITFHGPMLNSFFESRYTHRHFRKALMQPKPLGVISDPSPKDIWSPQYPPARLVIKEGVAHGPLIGGCMTLIRQLMGTSFEIETSGKIVFLEDLEEEPHNIDRMLSQLLLAGKFQQAAGIIIADCIDCRPGSSKRNVLTLNSSLEHVVRERLGNLGIPIVYGMRLGHGAQKPTLPLGVMASLIASRDKVDLKIEESATV